MTLHAAVVHFPIAFLLTASVLDIVSFVLRSSPSTVSLLYPIIKFIDPSSTTLSIHSTEAILNLVSLLSYLALSAGLVFAVPAVFSGVYEAYGVIKYRGLNFSVPVVRTTVVHAASADAMIALSAYNWILKKGNTAFLSEPLGVAISAVVLAGVGFAASLGGELTYSHGVSVRRVSEKPAGGKKEL